MSADSVLDRNGIVTGDAESIDQRQNELGAWSPIVEASNSIPENTVDTPMVVQDAPRKEVEEALPSAMNWAILDSALETFTHALSDRDNVDVIVHGSGQVELLARFTECDDRCSVAREQWEGFVLEKKSDAFFARLVDIAGERPDEEAEISLSEVSEDDRHLVEPGAFFYWSGGHHVDDAGQRWGWSLMRFRRLPPLTDATMQRARRKADAFLENFGMEH